MDPTHMIGLNDGLQATGQVGRLRWRAPVAVSIALIGLALWCARDAASTGLGFLSRLNLRDPPLAAEPVLEPAGPPLSRRVVLLIVDGLGADYASGLPALDRLRRIGVDAVASSHAPTLSRPN